MFTQYSILKINSYTLFGAKLKSLILMVVWAAGPPSAWLCSRGSWANSEPTLHLAASSGSTFSQPSASGNTSSFADCSWGSSKGKQGYSVYASTANFRVQNRAQLKKRNPCTSQPHLAAPHEGANQSFHCILSSFHSRSNGRGAGH